MKIDVQQKKYLISVGVPSRSSKGAWVDDDGNYIIDDDGNYIIDD